MGFSVWCYLPIILVFAVKLANVLMFTVTEENTVKLVFGGCFEHAYMKDVIVWWKETQLMVNALKKPFFFELRALKNM